MGFLFCRDQRTESQNQNELGLVLRKLLMAMVAGFRNVGLGLSTNSDNHGAR